MDPWWLKQLLGAACLPGSLDPTTLAPSMILAAALGTHHVMKVYCSKSSGLLVLLEASITRDTTCS